jgi:addiction module HigA family antidote
MAKSGQEKQLSLIHPGEILLEEFMRPLSISINLLSREIAVPPARISEIVNGKRGITADTALRLGKYFGVSPEIWIGLQADYDLRKERRRVGAKIDREVRPHQAA